MKRRNFKPEFKLKVVLEALKETTSSSELAEKYKLHPQQITTWKREFLGKASTVFEKKGESQKSESEQERDRLLQTIGELKVENDFLKKSLK